MVGQPEYAPANRQITTRQVWLPLADTGFLMAVDALRALTAPHYDQAQNSPWVLFISNLRHALHTTCLLKSLMKQEELL